MKQRKNIILIAIVVVLAVASILLLYRTFSDRPVSFVTPVVSSDDILIRNQIDRLDVEINTAMDKLEEGGIFEALRNNPQFQALSTEAVRIIEIGPRGRINPFIPVSRSTAP